MTSADVTLTAEQSLALRAAIDGLKRDDQLFSACPEPIRDAIGSIVMPAFSSSEIEAKALRDSIDGWDRLATKLAQEICDLRDQLRAARRAA